MYQMNDGTLSNRFRLCGKRLSGYNFAQQTPSGNTCSSSYK